MAEPGPQRDRPAPDPEGPEGEALRAIASIAGIEVSDEEAPRLAAGAVRFWDAARRLRELDLEAYREVPGTRFDPRWR